MIRPSPNELDRLRKDEFQKRRIQRLKEVRLFSKDHASKLRQTYKNQKKKVIEKIAESIQEQLCKAEADQIDELKDKLKFQSQHVGCAHKDAENRPNLAEEKEKLILKSNIKANHRNKEAVHQMLQMKKQQEFERFQKLEAKNFAMLVEKERAAAVSALPPQNKEYDMMMSTKNEDDKPRVKVCDKTKYSLIESTKPADYTVEKRRDHVANMSESQINHNAPFEMDAMEAGEMRQQEIQKNRQNHQIEMVEYDLKAHLRGNQALKKQLVRKDYSELVDNLEQISKSEMMKRQKDYFKNEILSSAAGGNASLIHNQAMKQFKERCRERAVENVVIDSLRDVTNQQTNHSKGFSTVQHEDDLSENDNYEENDQESISEMAKLYSLIKKQKRQQKPVQSLPDSYQENAIEELNTQDIQEQENSKPEQENIPISQNQHEDNDNYGDINPTQIPMDLVAKERERLERDVEEIELKIQQILASKKLGNVSDSILCDNSQNISISNPFNDTITNSVDPTEYQRRIQQFQQNALEKMGGRLDKSDLSTIYKFLSNNSLDSTSQSADSWEPQQLDQSIPSNFDIPPLPTWISRDTTQVNIMDYLNRITKPLSTSSSSLSSTVHSIPSTVSSSSSTKTKTPHQEYHNSAFFERNGKLDQSELSNANISSQSNEEIAQISRSASSLTMLDNNAADRSLVLKPFAQSSSSISYQSSQIDVVSSCEDITKITAPSSQLKGDSRLTIQKGIPENQFEEITECVDLDATLVPSEDDIIDDVYNGTELIEQSDKNEIKDIRHEEDIEQSTPAVVGTQVTKSSVISDYEQFLASLSQKLSVNTPTFTTVSDNATQQTLIIDDGDDAKSLVNADTDDDDIEGQSQLFDRVEDFLKKCHSEGGTGIRQDSESFTDFHNFTFTPPASSPHPNQCVTSTMKPGGQLLAQPLLLSDMSSIRPSEHNEHNLAQQPLTKQHILQDYLHRNNARIQELLKAQSKNASLHTLPTLVKEDSHDDDDEDTIRLTDSGKPSSRNHSNGDDTNRTVPTQELVSLSSELDNNATNPNNESNGTNTARTNNTDGYFTDFGDNDIFNTFHTLSEYVSKDDSGETNAANNTNSTNVIGNSAKSINNAQSAESIDLMLFNSNNNLAHSIPVDNSVNASSSNYKTNTSLNVAFGSDNKESYFLLDQSITNSHNSADSQAAGNQVNNLTDCGNHGLNQLEIPSVNSSDPLINSMVSLSSIIKSGSSLNSSSHINNENSQVLDQFESVQQDTAGFSETTRYQDKEVSMNYLTTMLPEKSSADISSQSLASFVQNEALCEEETEFLYGKMHSTSANNIISSSLSINESQQSNEPTTDPISRCTESARSTIKSRLDANTEEMKEQLEQWKKQRLMRVNTCPPNSQGASRGALSVTKTSKDRKTDASEFKRRTEKLWNRCEEVQKYKQQKETQQERLKNQNKKKEYAEKIRQKQRERQLKSGNSK